MKKVLLVFTGLRTRQNEGSKHRLDSFIDVYKSSGAEVTTLAFVKDWPFGANNNKNCCWIFFPYILPTAYNRFLTMDLQHIGRTD